MGRDTNTSLRDRVYSKTDGSRVAARMVEGGDVGSNSPPCQYATSKIWKTRSLGVSHRSLMTVMIVQRPHGWGFTTCRIEE